MILLVTYVAVGVAVVAFAGLDRIAEFEDDDTILSTLATDVLGSPLDQIVVLAVLTSALASTQTTILPASRTTLSMARAQRDARGARGHPPPLPDAAHLHVGDRRARDPVVRVGRTRCRRTSSSTPCPRCR